MTITLPEQCFAVKTMRYARRFYKINKLETYNGCVLADSVRLGKTFTALAVIKYYELSNRSVLVLCPKKLADYWLTYKGNLVTNIFAKPASAMTFSATQICSETVDIHLGWL